MSEIISVRLEGEQSVYIFEAINGVFPPPHNLSIFWYVSCSECGVIDIVGPLILYCTSVL